MNSIVNFKYSDLINSNNQLLTIKELLISIGYNSDNLYIDRFWNSIQDDKWIYLDRELILWLDYKDVKVGKEKIIKFLKRYFTEDDNYKILNNEEFDINNFCFSSAVKQKYEEEKRGAHNKQYIIVSPDCFKELCMYVGTSTSKEIKKYYIELEKVFKFYLEYQNEYRKYELESIINEQKEILDSTIKNTKLDKHKMLIEKFKNKQCIYIIEVHLENELNLIKIGSTKNIYDRISAMNSSYSCECILLDIYECETNYREIEQYILTNKDIKKNLYKEKINNVMPKEIVKLSEYFNYEQLINIIQDSIKTNIYLTPVQLLEKQKMDLVNRLLDNGYNPNLFENFTINIITKHEVELKNNNNYCNQNKINTDEIINNFYKNTTAPENELINEPETKNANELINESAAESVTEPEIEFNNNFSFKIKNTRGRKIQKINPNNLNVVVQVYDSMIHVLRSNDGVKYSKGCIQHAIKYNTLYKGFRWCFVEKNEDPNISKAKPTTNKINRITEPIVKINESKTEIIDIYNNQEECFLNNGLTKAKLKELILNNTLFHNIYFCKISDCDPEILHKYNISNTLFKKQTKSKSIIAINPLTKEEIIFKTISEIPIKLGGTSCSINSAIKNKTIYNGYYWKLKE
jgi:phage anti-repressor protein